MAVRLGTRLTGQTDSESASDSVYNSQLRRRLWRQIVWIDGRSHQHIGLKPPLYELRGSPLPANPLPANLNDADINPNMTEIPMIHKGPTEMTCKYMPENSICLYTRGLFSVTDTGMLQSACVDTKLASL